MFENLDRLGREIDALTASKEPKMRIARFGRAITRRVCILLVLTCTCTTVRLVQGQVSTQISGQQSEVEREGERRARTAATVEGRVFDRDTGKPVADAIVEWSFGDQRHSDYTNGKGQFKFLVARARRVSQGRDFDISANGEISLRAVANLYQTEETHVPVRAGKTVPVEIGLRPKPPKEIGVVRGTLTNKDTGRPLANVVVTILGAGQPLMTTTAVDGSFTISGVGFSRNLTIQFKTRNSPCIATLVRPLEVTSGIITANLAIPVLKLAVWHCPS